MNEIPRELFLKTRKRKFAGDVVGIPFSNSQMVQGVVLWQSFYYKNVILVGICKQVMSFDDNAPELSPFLSMVYTSAGLIKEGDWKIIGKTDVSWPEAISTRLVSSNLWIGDRLQGEASHKDRLLYPQMSVAGGGAVVSCIRHLLGLRPADAFDKKLKREMEHLLSLYLKNL